MSGTSKATTSRRAKPKPPLLGRSLSRGTAFRLLARSCLADIASNRTRAAAGDGAAIHEMRVAITRLKAAAAFFLRLDDDDHWPEVKKALKTLNRSLGAVRDIDVAIEALSKRDRHRLGSHSSEMTLRAERATTHRRLAVMLRTPHFEKRMTTVLSWVDRGQRSARHRADGDTKPVAPYCKRKVNRWLAKCIRQGRGLAVMGAGKRHRLRIRIKRLRYMIEACAPILAETHGKRLRKTTKLVRKLQHRLGQIQDTERLRLIVSQLTKLSDAHRHNRSLANLRKREAKLMNEATDAFHTLGSISSL